MNKIFVNEALLSRFDGLIQEGEAIWTEVQKHPKCMIMDIVGFTQWTTSCLNLLDKLSVSTNRFVSQFEVWAIGGPGKQMNAGAALGVMKSARHEYSLGMAIDYHLSVSAAVFGGLLDEASYLLNKGYHRASAVLLGAALEEGLKARARAVPLEIGANETLNPVIIKLKAPTVGVLTEFTAKQLEAVAKLRNDAAHGGDFDYQQKEVEHALAVVRQTLGNLLSAA